MLNYQKLFIIILPLIITLCVTDGNPELKNKRIEDGNKTLMNYFERFDPKNVRDRIEENQKLTGRNLSEDEFLNAMFDGIDATDDLFKIKLQNGDTRMAMHTSGRRMGYNTQNMSGWHPDGTPMDSVKPPLKGHYHKDRFNLRPRLFELMKQAIYQARNKMVIMQNLREKNRNSSLYKMGYLMSKTDNACKTFSKFTYRAYKLCQLARQGYAVYRVYLYDLLVCEERILNLWFTVDLLVDLINKNDHNCKAVIEKHTSNRLKHWKFVD